MSWCRNGGRDVYERPDTKSYDQSRPIRGEFVFEDGNRHPFTLSRLWRDAEGNVRERSISHVESEGVRFTPEGPTDG